jgi:class 3 adenylate cyclase
MAEKPTQRRLAAILVTDVVGYSRMMEQDEELTAERLGTCQKLISEKVTLLDGRIFNTAGDATLVEFRSAINALRCANEIADRRPRSVRMTEARDAPAPHRRTSEHANNGDFP